jgi:hypothetical protein
MPVHRPAGRIVDVDNSDGVKAMALENSRVGFVPFSSVRAEARPLTLLEVPAIPSLPRGLAAMTMVDAP